jgi:hypothetical protein
LKRLKLRKKGLLPPPEQPVKKEEATDQTT